MSSFSSIKPLSVAVSHRNDSKAPAVCRRAKLGLSFLFCFHIVSILFRFHFFYPNERTNKKVGLYKAKDDFGMEEPFEWHRLDIAQGRLGTAAA